MSWLRKFYLTVSPSYGTVSKSRNEASSSSDLQQILSIGYFKQKEFEPGTGGALTKLVTYQQCLIFRKSWAHSKKVKPLHGSGQEEPMAATFGVFLPGGFHAGNWILNVWIWSLRQSTNSFWFTQSKLSSEFWATHWDSLPQNKIQGTGSPPYSQVILLRSRKTDCVAPPALESISCDFFLGEKAGKLSS